MSQFDNLTPEFRESLRKMADKLNEKKQEAILKVVVKVAMTDDDPDIEIIDEGASIPESK